MVSRAPSRISLSYHLVKAGIPDDLRHLLGAVALSGKYIHHAIRTTELGLASSTNVFGEEQLKLDVLSNGIIEQQLCESGLVATYISEEQKEVVELSDKAPYSVAFDPLDGSSLVDVNFSIGSIFGIYPGSTILGKTPRDQVAALYMVYGPRTVLVYSVGKGVHEFVLNEVGEFTLLREYLGVGDEAKTYGPGNLRAVNDTPSYRALLGHWLDEELTLRYSGGMVPDVHHILSKGNGIFCNIGGSTYPKGKLRLVFECGPFAFLIAAAGGASSDGTRDILDLHIEDTDQRTPFITGSSNEVERAKKFLLK